MKVYIIKLESQWLGDPVALTTGTYVLTSFTEARKRFEDIVRKAKKEGYEDHGRKESLTEDHYEQYKESTPYDGHGKYCLHRHDGAEKHILCNTGELVED